MHGRPRLALLTGGTSGLGFAAARRILASGEWRVVITGRNAFESARAAQQLGAMRGDALELTSLASVRAFAARWPVEPRIDALICNAGAQFTTVQPLTIDGFEPTCQINHLSQFLLIRLLLPFLAPNARIVIVASGTHDPAERTPIPVPRYTTIEEVARRVTRPDENPRRAGLTAYSTSKLCNALCAYALAERLPMLGRPDCTVAAFDPGPMATGLVRDWNPALRALIRVASPFARLFPGMSTPQRSGAALAQLVVGEYPQGQIVRYVQIERERRSSKDSYDKALQRDLWEGSERLIGWPSREGLGAT